VITVKMSDRYGKEGVCVSCVACLFFKNDGELYYI